MAQAFLGRIYGDTGESELSAKSTSAAYRLRDRVSHREKFFIEASYYTQVTGNFEKVQETYESWGQDYPREYEAPGLLSGMIYPTFGKYEQAVEQAKRSIAIDPDVPFGYVNLATAYQLRGHYPLESPPITCKSFMQNEFPRLCPHGRQTGSYL